MFTAKTIYSVMRMEQLNALANLYLRGNRAENQGGEGGAMEVGR